MKASYHCGLSAWGHDCAYLLDICLSGQDYVAAWLDCFQTSHERSES